MNDFPMPKTLELPRARGLDAVAEAVAPSTPYAGKHPPGNPDLPTYKAAGHTGVIKEKLKQLTHREMKDLVAAIFAAHQKVKGADGGTDAITITNMPDVLDAFAYGD